MKAADLKVLKKHWLFILCIFIYTAALSYKLISFPKPFYDWDESIYVQVGKEMDVNHSATPLWQGQAWLEKPPLAPLLYGLLINYAPVTPEITTRLLSLSLSVLALGLIYLWVLKATKNPLISLLVSVIVACDPTFLQRAQTVNTDVFLLIGWLGYFLWFPRFWISLLFLFLGVFSKSLLGFYPMILMGAYEVYLYLRDHKRKPMLIQRLKLILLQAALMCVWFAVMIAFYGNQFIQVHFIDHMVRRVTSSIESHFGKRTYYLDLVYLQYGYYSFIAVIGLALVMFRYFRKKISDELAFSVLFLLPWFIFLNLTKTKISWYIYPAIPQVALLIAYPITFIEKRKWLTTAVVVLTGGLLIYQTFKVQNFLGNFYSDYDQTYQLSLFAKQNCSSMAILIDKDARQTYNVLSSMHLTISTSTLYGNHPSIVYYASIPVEYVYDKRQFVSKLPSYKVRTCLAIEHNDLDVNPDRSLYDLINQFDTWSIYRKTDKRA